MIQTRADSVKTRARKKPRRPLDTTRLTRDYYRERGWCVTYVQRTIKKWYRDPITKQLRRRTLSFDAFGFADHFAFPYPWMQRPEQGTFKAIQTCAVSDIAPHFDKIVHNARGLAFLEASPGHSITIMAWARGKNRGDPIRRRVQLVRVKDYEKVLAGIRLGAFSELKKRVKKEKPMPLFEGVQN